MADILNGTPAAEVLNRVYIEFRGSINPDIYESFNSRDEAVSFWWACAKSIEPCKAYMWIGSDGYQSNDNLKSLPPPVRLVDRINFYKRQLDDVATPARESSMQLECSF